MRKILAFLLLSLVATPFASADYREQIPGLDYYETVGGGGGGSSGIGSSTTGYGAYYSSSTAIDGSSLLFFDTSNSRIGIGTDTPAYMLDVAGAAHFAGTGGLTVDNGGGLRSNTTTAHTALLQAYDLGAAGYHTWATLTAGNPSTFDLGTGTTLNGSAIVNLSATQTLTNKTLTAPVISTISNTGTVTLPTATDTLVARATTDTLTNKTLTSPKIGTSILDTNGAILYGLTATGSAANYVTYANAATGADPNITVSAGDTNRGYTINAAGTGGLTVVSTNTGPSLITRGLTVNNGANNGAGDDLVVKTTGSANAFVVDASADTINAAVPIVSSTTITSTATADIGWAVVDQTDNQACTTGCTNACVFGIANATGTAVTNIVGCSDATADLCLCAGAS